MSDTIDFKIIAKWIFQCQVLHLPLSILSRQSRRWCPKPRKMRLATFLLLAFIGVAFSESKTFGSEPWYSNAIVYQLYPRSFQDSDGNGVGDLNGILQRVDYLGDLGIDAIWMNPIYRSPDKDFGYDISDFRDIQPNFGTMDVFKKLVSELKDRGIKVIMDFVPNHSSDEHPWFSKSEHGEAMYKDYYVWLDGIKGDDGKLHPPNNWVSMFGGSMWNYSETRQQFYLHQFLAEQPDLNYRNPRVLNEMLDVLKFWMDIGVGGFRMDAIASLVENESFADEPFIGPDPNNYGEYNHTMTLEQPETFTILEKFMEALRNHSQRHNLTSQLVMSENYNKDYQKIKMYYGTKENPRSTFPMNMFWIMYLSAGSNASQWADTINDWNLRAMPGDWATANWVLGNHDQHRVTSRFTPDHPDILNMIQLSLKGVAVVYYGDEIGLLDSIVRRDQTVDPQGLRASDEDFSWRTRDPGRGPMPWTNGTNGNFTTKKEPWLPLSPNYWTNNVAAQMADDRSHLSVFRTLARLKKTETMMYGDLEATYDSQCLIIYRSLSDNPTIITLVNVGFLQDTVDLRKSRPSLPEELRILVASGNYKSGLSASQVFNSTILSSDIVLPPLGGLVLTTALHDEPSTDAHF